MIRGIMFQIPQETTKTLWKILHTIDVTKYCWYCIRHQTEVWDKVFGNDFFKQEYYNGENFLKHIQLNHYIVFLKLQVYYHMHNFKNICTYDDFMKSDCQILILINDCEYVEIYAKEQTVIDSIFQNATQNGYRNITYITDSNDNRTKMNIL